MSNYFLFIVVNLQHVFTAFDAYSSVFFYIKSSVKKVWTNRSTAADFVLKKIEENRQVIITGAASVKKKKRYYVKSN